MAQGPTMQLGPNTETFPAVRVKPGAGVRHIEPRGQGSRYRCAAQGSTTSVWGARFSTSASIFFRNRSLMFGPASMVK